MAAPTFIAAYNTSYTATGTPKTLSVTTQAGDVVVVYGGGNTVGASTALTLTTPTGNSISFTLLESIAVNNKASAYIWSGVDATGGTNWTLSCSASDASTAWGFSCAVFRNSTGTGASDQLDGNGAPSLALSTTQAESAIVVFNHDWAAVDGASRTWNTVNGITPTSGNGLELTYSFNASTTTVYGAYYNDAGTAGSKTVGLSAPGSQSFSLVTAEVLGTAGPLAPTVTTEPVTDVNATTATGNGTVVSDGGGTITERGVCWNTSPTPTTANSKATSAGTTGPFTVSITGLSPSTLYYARAYAINSAGTSYGTEVTFINYAVNVSWLSA